MAKWMRAAMKLKRGSRGYTLIEVLVGMTILAVVVGTASTVVITMMRLTPQTNSWAIALRQVQNAGYWISLDTYQSQTIVVGTGSTYLTMTQPQLTPTPKTVVYQWETTATGQRLLRNDGTNTIMISEYISGHSDPVYNSDNRTLSFDITAHYGNVTVPMTYEATQRVGPPQ